MDYEEREVHDKSSFKNENLQEPFRQEANLNQSQRSPRALYDEFYECVTSNVMLYHYTDILGDGNCLFHSLIRVLRLQITTAQLRKQLYDSPYLYSCQNPDSAREILASESDYGDLDCVYIFSRV